MKNINDIRQLQEFNNLEFIAKHVVEGFITGLHKSPFHGFSVEFAEHRLYNTGESTKNIDWKLFARTDKLFVKRYEEETNLRSHILIDTSSSMLFPYKEKRVQSKLAFSVFCSAALIYLLRKQRDAVGLTLFSDQIEYQSDSRLSPSHAQKLFSQLENLLSEGTVKLNQTTSVAQTLHQVAENIHKRSLVIIFSDMMDKSSDDNLFQALQHLRHNKHDVILFHVTDKQFEHDFNFDNRPYKFIDLETGQSVKLNPNEYRTDFVQNTEKRFNLLKLRCGQYKIDLVEANIRADFKEILIPYLIKRSKLF